MHILFVCNGNVCRSVIAERLTRSIAVEYRLAGITAESAGTRALVGFPVEPRAAEAITGLGGDPGDFRARKLKPEHIDRADLVLTMTENIRDEVAELTAARSRTFTLLEAYRIARVTGARTVAELHRCRDNLSRVGRENIADPVGLSARAYCEVGDKIADALVPLLVALAPAALPADHHNWGRQPVVVRQAPSPKRLSPLVTAQHNGWYA
ncbi:low molecular weight phosphatase family protein [Nocardia sp. NPDC019395]|uniref:arsenate reductase/protein-tyrosine-phosphatase family protein n=1 Tax=Nocardia sp. NPDC019395 TaxID=3154686 RepID=UPI0033ED0503